MDKALHRPGAAPIVAKRYRKKLARHSILEEDAHEEVLAAIVNKGIWSLIQEQHRILIRVGFPGFSVAVLDDLESFLLRDSNSGVSKNIMSESLENCVRRQRALVATVLSRRKGKVSHLDGTLPLAKDLDPRLTRKRRFNASDDSSSTLSRVPSATFTASQQKTEHTNVLEQSKPTTLAGKAKILPAPDPDTLNKLAETVANPRKTRSKRTRK